MAIDHKPVVWFEEITRADVAVAGGKGANLGEMTNAGIPVPPGFIVTATAYFDFLTQTGITDGIRGQLSNLNVNDTKQLQRVAGRIQQIIMDAAFPLELDGQIRQAYLKMGRGLVAVRSSATAEDLPEASFAGQQATFLNVEGEEGVLKAVQKCWASLFNARAMFYREENHFDHLKVGIAVPVQRMVQSEASGVMFTVEPSNSNPRVIVIEAIKGLGEAIVSGDVTPDHYDVEKDTLVITNKEIKEQHWKLAKTEDSTDGEGNAKVYLTPREGREQKILDEDILLLAKIGRQLEEHYQYPQDIEWAKQDGKIYIVQTRPVTTLEINAEETEEIKAPVLMVGSPASPGVASGRVRIVRDPSEIHLVLQGEILVAEMTTPDFVPAMKRAAAIVTDRGGRTAHAAIVSRELGIPCVVGAENATKTLRDGQVISVDGSRGKVYEGTVHVATAAKTSRARGEIRTRTKLLVNLAQPDLAERVAERDVDGIGLLRAEFMVAQIGEHPSYMVTRGRTCG